MILKMIKNGQNWTKNGPFFSKNRSQLVIKISKRRCPKNDQKMAKNGQKLSKFDLKMESYLQNWLQM